MTARQELLLRDLGAQVLCCTPSHVRTGVHVDLALHAPGELPRSEGKAVRVIDRRGD